MYFQYCHELYYKFDNNNCFGMKLEGCSIPFIPCVCEVSPCTPYGNERSESLRAPYGTSEASPCVRATAGPPQELE